MFALSPLQNIDKILYTALLLYLYNDVQVPFSNPRVQGYSLKI